MGRLVLLILPLPFGTQDQDAQISSQKAPPIGQMVQSSLRPQMGVPSSRPGGQESFPRKKDFSKKQRPGYRAMRPRNRDT